MRLKLKSFLIWATISLLNGLSNVQHWVDLHLPALGDCCCEIRWAIERPLHSAFAAAFAGSREEERDAIYLEYGEELDRYSDRQQAIIRDMYQVEGGFAQLTENDVAGWSEDAS